MDTAFYVVSGIVALLLLILIARNLYILDNKDRRRSTPTLIPPDQPTTPVTTPGEPPPAEIPTAPDRPTTTYGPSSPTGPQTSAQPTIPPPRPAEDIPDDLLQPGRDEATPVPDPTNLIERGLSQEDLDRLRGGGDEESTGHETAKEAEEPSPEPVEFSNYYPKEVKPNEWQLMVAYVSHPSAADEVATDAKQILGDKLESYRETGEPARQPIAEGALITATPTLDGFQFNPPSLSRNLFEQWHRFDFKLRAVKAPLEQAANGRLTFTVEGIIVADLPLSIFVGENVSTGPMELVSRKPYDAIFCSYSRKDIAIVQRVERAYRALGNTYLRDMISIRSGEEWNDALKTLIEQADIFQLFWSSHSCTSEHCKMEWDYALSLESARDHFIRPVYWETPLPPVPDSLRKLHFAYEPELGS